MQSEKRANTLEPARNRGRLPTLNDVLHRKTMAPVDLFSFYIYMRDQQRTVDYLDFWCVHAILRLGRLY